MSEIEKRYISIKYESDAQYAAHIAKTMSESIGFKRTQSISISVVVSELANNICKYAQQGEVVIEPLFDKDKRGVQVVAEDYGPGIPDINEALKDGFSTNGTLGLGLSGVSRLMDEFSFDKTRQRGTKILVKKWL